MKKVQITPYIKKSNSGIAMQDESTLSFSTTIENTASVTMYG